MRPATAEHAAGDCSRILLRLGRASVNTPVGQTVVVVGGGGGGGRGALEWGVGLCVCVVIEENRKTKMKNEYI